MPGMSGKSRLFALVTALAVAIPLAAVRADATSPGLDLSKCRRVPLIKNAATPVGVATSCPGVRPGALVEVPKSADGDVLCTLNFVFVDKYKNYYIGTAGHCILGGGSAAAPVNAKKTWLSGIGPVALDSRGKKIGNFVFAIENDAYDFALIRLTVKANPQMCHFGGPTGKNDSKTTGAVVLHLFGNGIGLGDVLPARSGVTSGTPERDWVAAILPIINGDSGGPVTSDDGKAVGWVVATGYGFDLGKVPPHAGFAIIERISSNLAQAASALHTSFSLVTAKKV